MTENTTPFMHDDHNAEKSVDTISGATKEFLEARSATTPEAAKKEKIVGAIAIGIVLILVVIFALNS